MSDVEAWEPNGPACEGFTDKVWVFSGSLMYAAEIVVDISWGRHGREQATAA